MSERDDTSNPTNGGEPPRSGEPSPEEWARRRAALEKKLSARSAEQARQVERERSSGSSMQGIAEGLKLASEFAAGIIVGGGIGFVLDTYAGTAPFGLIVFLMLGFAAGIRNVLRSVGPKPANLQDSADNAGPPREKPQDF